MTEVFSDKDRFLAKLRGDPIGKDIFGNELYVGDYIVYGSMSGSSARLKTGRIIKIKPKKSTIPGNGFTVQVRAVVRHYNYTTKEITWQAAGTAGTLHNLSSNVLLWKDPDPIAVAALGELDA